MCRCFQTQRYEYEKMKHNIMPTPPNQQRTAVSPPSIMSQPISLSHYLQYLSDCVHETHVTILICFID